MVNKGTAERNYPVITQQVIFVTNLSISSEIITDYTKKRDVCVYFMKILNICMSVWILSYDMCTFKRIFYITRK